ncbi:hypothetical protein LguiB_020531 [Lonicera macranthoides]
MFGGLLLLVLLSRLLHRYSSSSSSSSFEPSSEPSSVFFMGLLLLLLSRLLHSCLPLWPALLKYGPIIILKMGSHTCIFISSHSLSHYTLLQNGAVFLNQPKPPPTGQITTSNQHNINSTSYGPTWCLFSRNLTSEILHPSRIKSYSHARLWVLDVLLRSLHHPKSTAAPVKVVDHLLYALFYFLLVMCFGDKLHKDQIKQIETSQRRMLLSFARCNMPNILNIFPGLGNIMFRKKWKEFMEMREEQKHVLRPLIESRISYKKQQNWKHNDEDESERVVAYMDKVAGSELPEEDGQKKKLTKGELVTLCSEFINAGTDTTSTALQWILANMVKYLEIQSKLHKEIAGVMSSVPPSPPQSGEEMGIGVRVVKEEDVLKMPYLKAVVLEELRRHPPSHSVLPHSVSDEVELEGYMDNVFDITGNKEIKMMPFRAGRRICPGFGLSILHLEYFVANLVWYYKWKGVKGEDVDLSEKQEFTSVMKIPLKAHISR